jgi:hypothetical protein
MLSHVRTALLLLHCCLICSAGVDLEDEGPESDLPQEVLSSDALLRGHVSL